MELIIGKKYRIHRPNHTQHGKICVLLKLITTDEDYAEVKIYDYHIDEVTIYKSRLVPINMIKNKPRIEAENV